MPDRRTLGPSTAHNRQSTASFGRQSCVGKRPVRSGKDPRDLHNKAMQKETKQKVIAFLAQHHYPAEISLKTLMNQKEFFAVVWFMIGTAIPDVNIPQSERTIDALIHHLKLMEYPYVPPKSTLQSCSSPLFLPAMLGLLEWLLDCANVAVVAKSEKMKRSMSGQEDRLDSRVRATERCSRFCAGFTRYIQGDDDQGIHVVELVEAANELAVEHAEKERERQRRVIEELDSHRNELQQRPDLVAGKLRELEALRQRQRTAGESISSSKVEVTSWQQQAADIENKARTLQLDMGETEREQLLVKKRIAHQPMDVQQAARVRDNLRREKRQYLKKQEQMREFEKEITTLKDEAYDRLTAIEALCDRLNNGLHLLKMCPTDAKYSRRQDLTVQVSPNTKEEACEKLLDTVLSFRAEGGLKALRLHLESRRNQLQKSYGVNLIETAKKRAADTLANIDAGERQQGIVQSHLEAEQTAEQEAVAKHDNERQQKEARIREEERKLQEHVSIEQSMADELETEVGELRSQLEQKAGSMQEDIERVLCEVAQMVEQVEKFKCDVESEVNKLNGILDEKYEAASAAAKQLARHAAM